MKKAKSAIIFIAGICIGSGVGFILAANLGSDSISVLQDGLHCWLHLSYSQAALLYNTLMILLAVIFARQFLGMGTIISALLTSLFIDPVFALSHQLLTGALRNALLFRGLFFTLGLLLYAFGLALLIRCRVGMNSLDSLLSVIQKKTQVSYRTLRIAADLLLTGLGALLQGVIGIGTVISILFTGVLIDFFATNLAARSTAAIKQAL